MCRKRRGSNTKIKFRNIFFSFLCKKLVNLVTNLYFCCIRYLFGESCSLITFEKIEIIRSKKVKMVLEIKFQDKTKSKRCIKMIVGRHCCYKGNGIYSGTCLM